MLNTEQLKIKKKSPSIIASSDASVGVCWPMQSASSVDENCRHSKALGHGKPNFFMSDSQRRADSQSDRHGGNGRSSAVQTGTYMEHRKSCKGDIFL